MNNRGASLIYVMLVVSLMLPITLGIIRYFDVARQSNEYLRTSNLIYNNAEVVGRSLQAPNICRFNLCARPDGQNFVSTLFDPTDTGASINIRRLDTPSDSNFTDCNAPTRQALAIPNSPVQPGKPLTIQSIRLTNIQPTIASNEYQAIIQIVYDKGQRSTGGQYARRLIPTRLLTVAAGANKQIIDCSTRTNLPLGSCPDGKFLRGYAADGSLVCDDPPSGGVAQDSCGANQYLAGYDSRGNPICNRLRDALGFLNCPGGFAIRGFNLIEGTVACVPMTNGAINRNTNGYSGVGTLVPVGIDFGPCPTLTSLSCMLSAPRPPVGAHAPGGGGGCMIWECQ